VRLCAGIDGGQSSTDCIVGDEAGNALGRAAGPPADLVGEARDSERQAAVLDGVLAGALADAGLPADSPFAAVVAGLSGYDHGDAPVPRLSTPVERLQVVHDAKIAHAGAFDGEPGIVVLAGTGSVAFGLNAEGHSVRVGGWGFLFGDEGSAFWIASQAIAGALADEDAGRPSDFGPRVLAHFGLGSLRALQHAVAHGEIGRPALAGFAAVVLRAAFEGDRAAEEIRRAAAKALGRLAHLAHRRLGGSRALRFAPLGGVFSDPSLLEDWKWNVREYERSATIVAPRRAPVEGAYLLACRAAAAEA
jgi:N-acetylglucosamine kinase-like BadF-type ATPase